MQKTNNAKIKVQKIKDTTYLCGGSSPSLLVAYGLGLLHVSLVGRLLFSLLLSHRIHLCHLLLLLLMPLGRILHVSIKCVLNLTSADSQSSEVVVDVLPS